MLWVCLAHVKHISEDYDICWAVFCFRGIFESTSFAAQTCEPDARSGATSTNLGQACRRVERAVIPARKFVKFPQASNANTVEFPSMRIVFVHAQPMTGPCDCLTHVQPSLLLRMSEQSHRLHLNGPQLIRHRTAPTVYSHLDLRISLIAASAGHAHKRKLFVAPESYLDCCPMYRIPFVRFIRQAQLILSSALRIRLLMAIVGNRGARINLVRILLPHAGVGVWGRWSIPKLNPGYVEIRLANFT
ncbi:hypothetical protein NM688_g3717 [Phlebia brevispora]|uniref:Uncharacterized protein n=1 Tax=Phlebia brevispora TaxID=194682 RepID=A0ACC1T513_9APHY|nr:hypothetical protein NM688_g3717 [Phlebia brevispora]